MDAQTLNKILLLVNVTIQRFVCTRSLTRTFPLHPFVFFVKAFKPLLAAHLPPFFVSRRTEQVMTFFHSFFRRYPRASTLSRLILSASASCHSFAAFILHPHAFSLGPKKGTQASTNLCSRRQVRVIKITLALAFASLRINTSLGTKKIILCTESDLSSTFTFSYFMQRECVHYSLDDWKIERLVFGVV